MEVAPRQLAINNLPFRLREGPGEGLLSKFRITRPPLTPPASGRGTGGLLRELGIYHG